MGAPCGWLDAAWIVTAAAWADVSVTAWRVGSRRSAVVFLAISVVCLVIGLSS